MTRPKAWLVAGSLLLAAGCARGSTSSTSKGTATSNPSIGATTAASTPAPSTTAATETPKGKVEEASLKQALITLSDLGPGFAELPFTPNEAPTEKGVCGKPQVSSEVPTATKAVIRFSKGSDGPFVQEIIGSYQDVATAEKFMATARSGSACKTYKFGEQDVTVAELNVGSHGNDTVAYRTSGPTNLAVAYLRFGSVIAQVGVGGLITYNDLMLAAVTEAAKKAATIR